jgi:cellulose synthase/poly-beta-1,6-N-acetylglucosamine synthase-like glycosyltransferase
VQILLTVIEYILIIYALYVSIYTFVLGGSSIFYKRPSYLYNKPKSKFAVLIPAYKEDGVIISVAQDALEQDYPAELYDVVVIADSLKPETLIKLHALPIKCIEVSFEKSTKVKALNKALSSLSNDYDYAVILDADNLMESKFLAKIEELHVQKGFQAIQGQRASKNDDTTLSFLDGLSENINNNIYGKGSVVLNMSASLKGSGMSFDFNLLKDNLAEMESIGGFDRELELRLVQGGHKVYYAHNAIVKDEKVEKTEVFENQRKRWISSQYFYLRKFFWKGIGAFFTLRITLFNSIVLRNLQLPRLINIGLINLLGILAIAINSVNQLFNADLWLLNIILLDLGVMLSISREYYSFKLVKSVFMLPVIFLKMFGLLFKLKGANKKFIHTPHGSTKNVNQQ